ncbi:MAG: ribose-phosphate diphosphokinase [Bacteroidia bacterium]|jgi:ribose-phosphate pyrophosphokinase|nr:ribose-phosphate diphosphokinase [Bacteroidia bacterium]
MKPILFHSSSFAYLAQNLLGTGTLEAGECEQKTFPDGERYHRILSPVDDRDVVICGGTTDDRETLEIFDMACAIVQLGARSLTLALPYFGYSTMERAVKPGEIVKAKTRALLFSSVPRTARGNRILLVDLHTEGLPYYFESGIRAVHLYAKPLIMQAARDLGGNDFVLASTDAGRAKWIESLALDLHVPAAFVYKRRVSGNETQVTGVNAEVNGRHVIIYDDMIRTGGSIIEAAKAYRAAGAVKVSVITTHGLFTGNGLERLRQSGVVDKIIATDTHPNAPALAGDFLEVRSVGELLAEKLMSR